MLQSIKNLFGQGPLNQAKIDKIAKLAANPYAQPEVRKREMLKLLDDGTPEAIRGVLKRFSSNASGHIADEEEKLWLVEELIDLGETSLVPLQDYIHTQMQLTYAMQAYAGIVGAEAAASFFLEALKALGPEDYRSLGSKLQLILSLAEFVPKKPALFLDLVPFLHDHSDDVRWAILDLCEVAYPQKTWQEAVKPSLSQAFGELVCNLETSPRIVRRVGELLAAWEWPLAPAFKTLSPMLADGFFLDKKNFVRHRSQVAVKIK